MRQVAGNLHEVGHDLHERSVEVMTPSVEGGIWLVTLQMPELQQAQGSSTSPSCTPQNQA